MTKRTPSPERPTASPEPGADEHAARPCAICGRPAVETYRPFCSKRCADIDLNRWLSGVYAVPAADDEPGPDDGGEPEPG